jgi:hypothetical protein
MEVCHLVLCCLALRSGWRAACQTCDHHLSYHLWIALSVTGASGVDKFKKTIEKDAALERRFQQVFVDQPSVPTTVSILRGLRSRYENYHGEHAVAAAGHTTRGSISHLLWPGKVP